MKKSVIIANVIAIVVWLIMSAIFGVISLSSGESLEIVMYPLLGPLEEGYYIVYIIYLLFLYLYYRVGLFRVYFWLVIFLLFVVLLFYLGISLNYPEDVAIGWAILFILVIFGFLVIPLFFLMLLVILFYFFYVRIRLPENERSI